MEVKEAILNIEINKVKEFLASFGLSYEDSIDKTLYIEDNDKIIDSTFFIITNFITVNSSNRFIN